MSEICIFMFKPHAIGTNAEIEALQLLQERNLEIIYEKNVDVSEDLLRRSQPILNTNYFNKEEQNKIINYSKGNSKFLVIKGENVFQKCYDVKWIIRDKYSNFKRNNIKKTICPIYVHCDEDMIEVESDVSTFLPEYASTLEFLRLSELLDFAISDFVSNDIQIKK